MLVTVVAFTFATINKTNTANKTKTLVFKYRFSDWNYLRHEFKFKSQVSMVKIIKVYVYFSSTKVNSDFFASNSIFDIEVLRMFFYFQIVDLKNKISLWKSVGCTNYAILFSTFVNWCVKIISLFNAQSHLHVFSCLGL